MLKQAVAPVGLVLAGVAAALFAGDSTTGIAAAIALIGCAAVVAVAMVFYAVGRAEDRDREEAARARRPPPDPPSPPAPPAHPRSPGLTPERRRPRPPRRPS